MRLLLAATALAGLLLAEMASAQVYPRRNGPISSTGVSTTSLVPSANTLNLGSTASAGHWANLYLKTGISDIDNVARILMPTAGATTYMSPVANSGTNVAHIFDTSLALSGSTLLMSVRNSTTEKFKISQAGATTASSSSTATAFTATDTASGYAIGGSGILFDYNSITYLRGDASSGTSIGLSTGATFSSGTITSFENPLGTQKAKVDFAGTATVNGIVVSGATYGGAKTLTGGTGTVTVASGCRPICTNTTSLLAAQCSVSSTTLTVNSGVGTDTVNWFCY